MVAMNEQQHRASQLPIHINRDMVSVEATGAHEFRHQFPVVLDQANAAYVESGTMRTSNFLITNTLRACMFCQALGTTKGRRRAKLPGR